MQQWEWIKGKETELSQVLKSSGELKMGRLGVDKEGRFRTVLFNTAPANSMQVFFLINLNQITFNNQSY